MTAINELYLVQNGVDDVVDNDHNTLVEASEFLNDTLGDLYNFGNGRDGNIKLGSIATNPTTAPTCIATGTGPLTATYYYQYSVYNLSGETDVSNSSSTVSPSSQNVQVTIPAYVTNSNVTGFYLYRSIDDVTYYRIATIPVEDATQGATWIDEIPATSGTAPAGSNTTGNSATFGGILFASSVTIQTGQTVTLPSAYPYLIIRCSGDVTIAGTINGSGLISGSGGTPDDIPSFVLVQPSRHVRLGTYGGHAILQGFDIRSYGGYAATSSSQLLRSNSRWMFKAGSGGLGYNSSTSGNAGGTLFVAAKGALNISSSSLTFNGGVGAATFGDGGGAGGTIVLYSTKYIKRTAATVSANGGNASTSTGGGAGSGGGGGGIVVMCSPFIIDSSTTTVNGGSGSSSGTPSAGTCGATGGGNGGAGGLGAYESGSGSNGSAGIILDTTPQVMSLPRV